MLLEFHLENKTVKFPYEFTRVLISETYFDTVVFGKVLQLLYRGLKFLEAKPVVEITGFSNTIFFLLKSGNRTDPGHNPKCAYKSFQWYVNFNLLLLISC